MTKGCRAVNRTKMPTEGLWVYEASGKMVLYIPVAPTANQTLNVQLAGQNCQLNIYQKAYGLFMDVYVGGTLIIGGVLCQNLNRIVRSLYLGFIGDFTWFDTQGSNDPQYQGIGTRYFLAYLETTDLPAGQG